MASLQRIVLLDMFGDEIFSGRSISNATEPPMPKVELEQPDEIEPCPETLRSSVFVRIHDGFVVDSDDDGAIDVLFGSDPTPLAGSDSCDDSIRETENSEIRATPASLGRVSQPEISAPSAPSTCEPNGEISVELVDSLFDDHAA